MKGRPPKYIGCIVEGCDGKHAGRGYCLAHYSKYVPKEGRQPRRTPEGLRFCRVAGCDKPYTQHQFCHVHYSAQKRGSLDVCLKKCEIPGCDHYSYTDNPFCSVHTKRWASAMGIARVNKSNTSTRGELNVNWNGGVSEYPNHYAMKKLRKEVLEEANYICQNCGGPADRIHHIDEDKGHQDKLNYLACCNSCNMGVFHKGHKVRPARFGLTLAQWANQFSCSAPHVYKLLPIIQLYFLTLLARKQRRAT